MKKYYIKISPINENIFLTKQKTDAVNNAGIDKSVKTV